MATLSAQKRVTRASLKNENETIETDAPSVTPKKSEASDQKEDPTLSFEEQRNTKCLTFESKLNDFADISVNHVN
jgi:hypothetical protein